MPTPPKPEHQRYKRPRLTSSLPYKMTPEERTARNAPTRSATLAIYEMNEALRKACNLMHEFSKAMDEVNALAAESNIKPYASTSDIARVRMFIRNRIINEREGRPLYSKRANLNRKRQPAPEAEERSHTIPPGWPNSD